MSSRPPRSTRPDPPVPDTARFGSPRGYLSYIARSGLTVPDAPPHQVRPRVHDAGVPGGGSAGLLRGADGAGAIWLGAVDGGEWRPEEHTSELQSLMRSSYAVFCLNTNNITLLTNSAFSLSLT